MTISASTAIDPFPIYDLLVNELNLLMQSNEFSVIIYDPDQCRLSTITPSVESTAAPTTQFQSCIENIILVGTAHQDLLTIEAFLQFVSIESYNMIVKYKFDETTLPLAHIYWTNVCAIKGSQCSESNAITVIELLDNTQLLKTFVPRPNTTSMIMIKEVIPVSCHRQFHHQTQRL